MLIKNVLMKTEHLIKILNNVKNIIIYLFFISLILSLLYIYKNNEQALSGYESAIASLGKKYKKVVYISNNNVKIVYKDKEKIVEKIVYLPPEGNVIIKDPIKPEDEVVVSIKNKGFTLRPGFGLSYNFNKLYPELDLKLLYYSRYSSGAMIDFSGIGIFVSRHIDDFMPFSAQNVEVFAKYNIKSFKDNNLFSIGIRSNF